MDQWTRMKKSEINMHVLYVYTHMQAMTKDLQPHNCKRKISSTKGIGETGHPYHMQKSELGKKYKHSQIKKIRQKII